MKYAAYTNLKFLTPSITEEILELSKNIDSLDKTVYISNGGAVRPVSKIYDSSETGSYKHYQNEDINGGEGFFAICNIPKSLEEKILKNIPDYLTHKEKPRIRLQFLQNFKLFPHIDITRGVSFFVMVSENDVDCVFYDQTVKHEFKERHLPDPNLIEERLRFRVKPGEAWLFDHNEIHGTTTKSNLLRITLTISYVNLTISDILKEITNGHNI